MNTNSIRLFYISITVLIQFVTGPLDLHAEGCRGFLIRFYEQAEHKGSFFDQCVWRRWGKYKSFPIQFEGKPKTIGSFQCATHREASLRIMTSESDKGVTYTCSDGLAPNPPLSRNAAGFIVSLGQSVARFPYNALSARIATLDGHWLKTRHVNVQNEGSAPALELTKERKSAALFTMVYHHDDSVSIYLDGRWLREPKGNPELARGYFGSGYSGHRFRLIGNADEQFQLQSMYSHRFYSARLGGFGATDKQKATALRLEKPVTQDWKNFKSPLPHPVRIFPRPVSIDNLIPTDINLGFNSAFFTNDQPHVFINQLRAEKVYSYRSRQSEPIPLMQGAYPYLGEIIFMSSVKCPIGWMPAAGQVLRIQQYPGLFKVLGAQGSSIGHGRFILPQLMPMGIKTQKWIMPCIALMGVKASTSSSALTNRRPYIGQVILFQGAQQRCPEHFAPLNGRHLPISQFSTLYTILGKRWGGNQRSSFALPDLKSQPGSFYCIALDGQFPDLR